MTMRSRIAVTFTAVAAAVSLTVGSPSPAPAADDPFPQVPDSATITYGLIASGVVQPTDSGSAGGIELLLAAQPTNSAADTVDLHLISKAFTSDTGAYELRVPDVAALLADADSDGLVELMIFAPADAAITPYAFSRRVVDGGSGRYLLRDPDAPPPTGGAAPATVGDGNEGDDAESVDLGEAVGPNTPDANETAVADIADEAAAPDNSTDQRAPGPSGCAAHRVDGFNRTRKAVVGQWFSTTSGVHANWYYSRGASSDLGVGWSLSGEYGSWKQSGTKSKESTATIGFPRADGSGGHYYLTKWDLQKYHYVCTGLAGQSHYEVSVKSFAGGTWVVDGVSAPSGNWQCKPYVDNAVLIKDNNTAITWSNGFDVSRVLGIDLSTRTGYTSKASLHINVTKNSGVHLCGLGAEAVGDAYATKAKP